MILTPLVTLVLALAPQVPSATPPSLEDPPQGFGYDLHLGPGESLLQYRWKDGARVPLLDRGPHVRIPWGERGIESGTRLALEGAGGADLLASGAVVLASRALGVDTGPFGEALAFAPGTFLRLGLAPNTGDPSGWTLSLWMRPEAGAPGRSLVLAPGSIEIALLGDRRVRARLLPSGPEVIHPAPVELSRWTFVSASYDPRFTRQLRLVVGETVANVAFPATTLERHASELQLGDVAGTGTGFVGALDELTLESVPMSTAGAVAIGRRRPAAPTTELELTTTSGFRTAAPFVDATRTLVLDSQAELAQGQLDGVVAEGGELRWVPARWHRVETRNAPPPRTTHPTLAVGNGLVFTYGGETRDTKLGPMTNTDDTWLYSRATQRWERVLDPLAPSGRCHIPAAYSPDHDLVLLVRGWRNDITPNESYGDTWVFHVGQRRWEQRFPTGIPGVGSDHNLAYLPAQQRFLMLLGGQGRIYDPVANTWQILPVASAVTASGAPTTFTAPGSAMCAVDPTTGLVWLFGGHYGQGGSTFSDTTASYDPVTNTFTVYDPPTRPSPRVRSGFAYDSLRGLFVLFGGVQDQFSVRHDDLWIFNPRTALWREIPCSNRPGRRGGFYGMAYDQAADDFVLFAGREDPTTWLDETQVLEIGSQDIGTALYTFDRVGADDHDRWFADVTTPGDSEVRFLFRFGDSGADWSPWNPSLARAGHARYVQALAFLKPGSAAEEPSIQRMGLGR